MEGTVRVRLDGVLSYILLKIDPENYGGKVFIERGKIFIHEVLKSALYGALIISLLLWRDLVRKLKYWGFHPNPMTPVS